MRTYHAAVATPISAGALFAGHVLWTCLRVLLSASVFLVVATILGGVPSWWGVLAIPAAVLGASVFAAALNAYAVTQDSDLPFAVIMRIGLFPLFLFSGTFFPTSRLPDWLQPVSWFSPLWHAVELCRAATTGSSPSFGTVAGHVAFLVGAPGGRLLVGRPAVHPGADRMISAIAVKEAGRRRAGSTGRGALRVVERNVLAYRRMWLAFVTGLFEPLLYLLSIGIGVGGLVGKVPGPGGQPIPYDQFVAPGLMAAAAMNGAVLDTTFNFFFKFKYAHTYDAMLATPLEVGDVAQGELTWALIRGAIYSAAFLLTMLVLGLVGSWWAVLALPAAALIAFGFAGAGIAATTYMRSWTDFDFVNLALIPMFLFAATFFPLSQYPVGLQWVVRCTPLYQGVALERGLTTGQLTWTMLLNVTYLTILGTVGLRVATRRLRQLLQP